MELNPCVNVPYYGFAVAHQHHCQMAPFNNLLYGNIIEMPIANSARKCILERSVFDLVKPYHALELTDPKLLCWYLSLSPDDRKLIQDEGGFLKFLQRHPALELGKQHVYVKYDTGCFTQLAMSSNVNRSTFDQVTSCATCGTSSPPGATACRHCNLPFQRQPLSEQDQHSYLLTSCGYPQSNSQEANAQLGLEQCHINQILNQLHNPTKDMALKQSGQRQTPDSADLLQDQNILSGYYSLDGTQMVPARCDDAVDFLAVEPKHVTSKEGSNQLISAEASRDAAGGDTVRFWLPGEVQKNPICGCDRPCGAVGDAAGPPGGELCAAGERGSESFPSIMQEDESILLYKASETLNPLVNQSTAGRPPSTSPPVESCDKSVGTELSLTPCQPAATQTNAPAAAAKSVNTVLQMADLDYVVEEFRKLKLAQKELQDLKENVTSGGGAAAGDSVQRAQKAELSLLALQHGICQQHCWRHYYTSPDGDRFTRMQGDKPMDPPESLVGVLQTLQGDYEEMRAKILAGVHLDTLKPLSVDSHKLSTGGPFIPAQIIGDALENKGIRSRELESEDNGGGGCQNSKDTEETHNSAPQAEIDGRKAGRAVSIRPRPGGSSCGWTWAEAAAACSELNVTEDWYDAEEDLEPAEPACAAEMGPSPSGATHPETGGSVRDLKEPEGTLCVSDLPRDVTEGDVKLWFEKYRVSDVAIAQFKDGLRFALVGLCDPQLADPAVREMNGFRVRGSVLRVEHVGEARPAGQASSSIPSAPAEVTPTSQSSETASPKMVYVQADWSSERRRIVSDKPTAKGTYMPQCYASMGGFDALMAQLAERHPQVERQKFVDALEEVVAQHEAVLVRLPLTTIADMISDLLRSS